MPVSIRRYRQTKMAVTIDRTSLNFFKAGFLPGMEVYIKVDEKQAAQGQPIKQKAIIKEIYPFIVLTDKGTFQWKQLYIWNSGRIIN